MDCRENISVNSNTIMNDLHYIQLAILKKLLFSEGLRFSELKPFADLETNQLTFPGCYSVK